MDNLENNMSSPENSFVGPGKRIYLYLYQKIVMNEWKPGQMISESALVKEFGVSRTPVRDSLLQLAEDGLVRRERGHSYVQNLDLDEYMQISYIRSGIESEAIRLAAHLISENALHEMKQIISDMEKYDKSSTPFPANDTRFHEIIIREAHNPFLESGYLIYRAKLTRYRWYLWQNVSRTPEIVLQELNIHRAIYNALSLHLKVVAVEELASDINLMRRRLHQIHAIQVQSTG